MKCRDGSRYKWIKFFPLDWLADVELRRCSIAARGLWIDLICLMTQGRDYGRLVDANGERVTIDQLHFDLRYDLHGLKALVDELIAKRVCSVDEHGVIYSRRMIRDNERSETKSRAGKLGGNPALKTSEDKTEARDQMLDARGCLSTCLSTSLSTTDTHAPWKPLESDQEAESLKACLECLATGHRAFAAMSVPDQAKLATTLQSYAPEYRRQGINQLVADFAGDAPMKYPPAQQLRYALENAQNPRQSSESPRKYRCQL